MEREHRTPEALREVLPSSDRMRAFFELFDDWDCFDGFEGRNPKRRPGRKKLQLRSAFFIAHAHMRIHAHA